MAVRQKPTRLGDAEVEERLRALPEWRREGDAIIRTMTFKDFREAKAFVDLVADVANETDHHPDIHLENWNQVRLVLSTHSVRGLSDDDFAVAARIEKAART
jgi:4a-hydroxytetrahydrobiopterin dehydratase